jgi:hypothetical protein
MMPIQPHEQESFDQYEAVAAALAPYINGAKTGDGTSMRPAFYEHAHIVGSLNGSFENAAADDFCKDINQLGASPAVKHRIAWIDISGPAAAAKVEFVNFLGFRFTDFFVLYQEKGVWRISGKVYDSHAQN